MSRETIGYRYRNTLSDSFTRELFIFLPFLRDSVIGESCLIDRVTSRDANTKNLSLSLSLSFSLVSIWRNCLKNFIADDSSVVTFRRRVGIFLNCYEKFLARRFLNPNSSIIHEDSKIAESREYRHLRLAFAPLITQLLYN